MAIVPPHLGQSSGSISYTRLIRAAQRYALDFGGTARIGRSARALAANVADERITLGTGPLRLELEKASGCL